MIDYIKGEVAEMTPTAVVLEQGGIGYSVNIALSTYSEISSTGICKLYIHEAIREDAHVLYGFLTKEERELFLLLISVSGVGANTARMMLSSLSASELQEAIASEQVSVLKRIKGIGGKTAERIIVDLKDKMCKLGFSAPTVSHHVSATKEEAIAALVMLGFQQAASQKAVEKLLQEDGSMPVERLIKQALQML